MPGTALAATPVAANAALMRPTRASRRAAGLDPVTAPVMAVPLMESFLPLVPSSVTSLAKVPALKVIRAWVAAAVIPVLAVTRLIRAASAMALVALPEYDSASSPGTVSPTVAVPAGPVSVRSPAASIPRKRLALVAPVPSTSASSPRGLAPLRASRSRMSTSKA